MRIRVSKREKGKKSWYETLEIGVRERKRKGNQERGSRDSTHFTLKTLGKGLTKRKIKPGKKKEDREPLMKGKGCSFAASENKKSSSRSLFSGKSVGSEKLGSDSVKWGSNKTFWFAVSRKVIGLLLGFGKKIVTSNNYFHCFKS